MGAWESMDSTMRSEYHVAIVTGASSGIGAELARQLARAGVRVGLTARRVDLLEAVAGEIRAKGGVAAIAPADAADSDATRRAIVSLTGELGPVDLLIANAGLGLSTPSLGFSAREFEQMVRVNLLGAAVAIEAVLPGMIERGQGRLVGVSSLAAFRGLPVNAGYSATKAGLSTLLEGLRVDLRRQGVFVTIVHPGFVRTPMIEDGDGERLFVMEVDRAARIILNGVASRRRYVNFPWPTVALMRFARALPGPFFDALVSAVFFGHKARVNAQAGDETPSS
jgi:short-subunit dehydrogenase